MATASLIAVPNTGGFPAGSSRTDQNPLPVAAPSSVQRQDQDRQATMSGEDPNWRSATRLTLSKSAEERFEREALLRFVIERNLSEGPTMREVVYQAIDTRSGDVIYQVPTEAALKLQIYARTMAGDPSIRTREFGERRDT